MRSYDTRFLLRQILSSPDDIPIEVRRSLQQAHNLAMIMTCVCGEWYRECDC